MNIPREAVEAAYDSTARLYLDGEDLGVILRAALEAAGPILMAQAWNECADAVYEDEGCGTRPNPYEAA